VIHALQLYGEKLRLFSHNARLVLVYSGIVGLTRGVFQLLFNFYVLSLGGYDERFLGILTSVMSTAALAAAIPAAYIAERFSQRRIMIVTALVSALSFLGFLLLPYRFFLIFFNLTYGLASSIRQVTVPPFLMGSTSDEERQYVFSFNSGSRTVASFVGNMLGGVLPGWLGGAFGAMPTDTFSYQLALGLVMLVEFMGTIPVALLRTLPPLPGREITMPWTLIWNHRSLLAKLIAPSWIIGIGAGLMMPFMNIYYRNVFGRSDAAIGVLFAIGALAMGIAQFAGPPLTERMGKANVVVLTQALSVPFLMTLGLAAWVVPGGNGGVMVWFLVAALAYLVRLALMNLGNPVYQTFVLEQVEPDTQALAISLERIANDFGRAFSPYLSGWFLATYGDFGFVPVFSSTSALYIVGIVVTWAFFVRGEKRRAPIQAAELQKLDGK
jgi:MFS family permease